MTGKMICILSPKLIKSGCYFAVCNLFCSNVYPVGQINIA